ncbi:uncharacterized protein LOC110628796 isoform X2 [Manihot esculenta]|uniref:uncharacterized protein LOC110628796 isoform X2 n=1 Tax=Manihot esculenta TaxID=3983 RepID=UPI001CC7172C|nr:uncharacterized protein LOC110628796 isoform X2 [Manihot esculenta]
MGLQQGPRTWDFTVDVFPHMDPPSAQHPRTAHSRLNSRTWAISTRGQQLAIRTTPLHLFKGSSVHNSIPILIRQCSAQGRRQNSISFDLPPSTMLLSNYLLHLLSRLLFQETEPAAVRKAAINTAAQTTPAEFVAIQKTAYAEITEQALPAVQEIAHTEITSTEPESAEPALANTAAEIAQTAAEMAEFHVQSTAPVQRPAGPAAPIPLLMIKKLPLYRLIDFSIPKMLVYPQEHP